MSSPEVEEPVVTRLRTAGCVFAEEEAALLTAEASGADLEGLVRRRVAGEPLEHVLGWADFDGHRVRVRPGVFVPRSSSVALVVAAVTALAGRSAPVAVDLCCGSGAVGAALARRVPGAEVHACDLDPVAVGCARLNLPAARVHQGQLLDALPPGLRGRLHVVAAHAPHVPSAEIALMPQEARLHEPMLSLDGGPDGLVVQRAVAAQAAGWLAPDGVLLLECSAWSLDATRAVCERAGWTVTGEPQAVDDLSAVVRAVRSPACG